MGDFNDLNLEDFKPEDFQDPLALLDALNEKRKKLNISEVEKNDYLYEDGAPLDELLSITDIERRFKVPLETVRSAIKTRTLTPVASIPLFSASDVARFIESSKTSLPPAAIAFLKEIEHMRTNYSYKPLLFVTADPF